MGEVSEVERGAAEVLESAVDGLRRPVAGAGSVEEREHVGGALFQRATEPADLDERGGDPAVTAVITFCSICLAFCLSGSR